MRIYCDENIESAIIEGLVRREILNRLFYDINIMKYHWR